MSDPSVLPKQLAVAGLGLLALGFVFSLRPFGLPPLVATVTVPLSILLLAAAGGVAGYRWLKDVATRP
jgi:hypothetical protein